MMFPRSLTTLILTLTLSIGTQFFMPTDADAKPGSILSQSRKSGKRVHKGNRSASSSKSSSSKKKSSKSSKSNRRVVRRTTTRSAPTRTTTTRSTPTRTTTRRTVHRRPSTHTRTRTTRTVHRSRPAVRRSYYRSGHRHTSHRHVHSSSHVSHHSHTTTSTSRNTSPRTHGRATIEPYITGGLGISGFASNQIVDGALPGVGYNLALGAKGKLFGAELGLNGGGYTFTPGTVSTDLALVGLSGDLKIQPSIAFFEPFALIGLGGYALHDGIMDEASAGVGLRLGAGADFRFDNAALRISYMFGAYGLGNDSGVYGDGDLGARTETLSAGILFYF